MKVFIGQAKDGGLNLGSEFNATRFRQFLKDNNGIRIRIEPELPESRKQRKFFEGAVLPMIAFYQEGMDHNNPDHIYKIREWLKLEFNAEIAVLSGKAKKIAGSTKGKLEQGFLEKVLDWMTDQGYKTELLRPKDYLHWRDAIYPYGGPETYTDYLVSLKKLP
jgi:hypothetical protein